MDWLTWVLITVNIGLAITIGWFLREWRDDSRNERRAEIRRAHPGRDHSREGSEKG